jgi:folate-binding protein YgfZ
MDRRIVEVSGADRLRFLQGLVTNDVERVALGPVYAALLSPQGKYLADFVMTGHGEAVRLDVAAPLAEPLLRRLTLYKLRARVALALLDLPVARGTGTPPEGAHPDPRDPALGWRLHGEAPDDGTDWDALRVAHVIPEGGVELIPDDSYVLEMGFERLHGVDFRKGCYVGQEVTARMKHKTELRKGLARVEVEGAAPVGTPILADGRAVGTLFTQSGGRGLAHLRFDRAGGAMTAGEARVAWEPARAA